MKITIRKIDNNTVHDKVHMWVDGALCAVVMLKDGEYDKFCETLWKGTYEFEGKHGIEIESEK